MNTKATHPKQPYFYKDDNTYFKLGNFASLRTAKMAMKTKFGPAYQNLPNIIGPIHANDLEY